MASPLDSQVLWSNIALLINGLFDQIVWSANARRKQLLEELENERLTYEAKNRSVLNSITELGELIKSMEEMGLKENQAVEALKQSIIPIEGKISSLKSCIITPSLEFKSSCKPDLLSEISRLGTLVHPLDYKTKLNSFKTIGTQGSRKGELNGPQRIHFDSDSNTLFVADLHNHCVQIFGIEGNFISQFGQDVLKAPCGVSIDGEGYYYVTDAKANSIFKFGKISNLPSFGLFKQTNFKLHIPIAVKVFNGEIFVVEKMSHRVSVFDTNLNFLRTIGDGRLKEPKALDIYNGDVWVIDKSKENNLKVFSIAGNFIRASTLGLEDAGQMCFDREGNLVVTDYGGENIKIFSRTGDLIHKIGTGAPATEDISLCTGLALNKDTIIVSVHYPDDCIKFF